MPWKDKNKISEYQKRYYSDNREKIKEKHRKYYLDNTEKLKKYQTEYKIKNKEKIKEQNKNYALSHKNQKRERGRKYEKIKKKLDPQYSIAWHLRRRLYNALKGDFKKGSAIEMLGCSIQKVKLYLEAKFELGMSWDNHGKWHIDHIIPLSKFNLQDMEQLKLACHYTNLQPLWAFKNLSKGGKV